GNHVLYRVTPVFEGDDLLAKGVVLEALSVEDEGKGIMFHVYCYNVQPGIEINYADGSSRLEEDSTEADYIVKRYVCNVSTKKFHEADCSSAYEMKEENKKVFKASRATLIEEGYTPCGICNP
ncbi:MAG: hypothetical protein IKT73_05330, partial [Anaerotignum sp.]|nr:hypothetical protein [Anaerotignum sp.]